MNKDRITIAYILVTITILVVASIYIYNIDLNKSNAQIGKKAERVYGSGKEYSEKIYSMVSAYSKDVGHYFDDKNDTKIDISNDSNQKKNKIDISVKKKKSNQVKAKVKKIQKKIISVKKLVTPIDISTLEERKISLVDINDTKYKTSSIKITTKKDIK